MGYIIDRTIPYKNFLMRCDIIKSETTKNLPDGFSFKMYEAGDESLWADIEIAIGEFINMSKEQVEEYFRKEYFQKKEELGKRCIFIMDEKNNAVASCTAWFDEKGDSFVPSVHWLAVHPEVQEKGLGRAVLRKTMEVFQAYKEVPVYLHTQPWSFRAIKLYLDMGFCAVKSDTFSDFVNEYEEAVKVLEEFMPYEIYKKLVETAI